MGSYLQLSLQQMRGYLGTIGGRQLCHGSNFSEPQDKCPTMQMKEENHLFLQCLVRKQLQLKKQKGNIKII
jgi:hypothetical protein